MDNEIYTLWIKSECPYCIKAQEELFNRKKFHTLYIMDDKLEELNEVKKLWNQNTVPLITVQNGDVEVFIGGYTDLVEWFENQDSKELEND